MHDYALRNDATLEPRHAKHTPQAATRFSKIVELRDNDLNSIH